MVPVFQKADNTGGSRPSEKGGGGGWGSGHPDSEIREKTKFSRLWASVWSKNKGGDGPAIGFPKTFAGQ